ncbi:MFS transporter [Aidingimonas lacisalsi]|uniref:MFS transporter n=1 Tax=Aidingimonas lacisalsi TaxID=2604086 RepID=UPI0011D23708|nr:MFS transporter [Aidingimonas lacisalsi]
MSLRVLLQRRFAALFLTQVLGAINDNVFRHFLILTLAYAAIPRREWESGLVINLAVVLFLLPYLLVSAWGGVLADRYDRTLLIRRLKLLELAIILLAVAVIGLGHEVLLWILLLMMGVQSALFAPVKYALLPQLVSPTELLHGNAWMGLGIFVAMPLGILLVGIMVSLPEPWQRIVIMSTLLMLAVAGVAASLMVPRVAEPRGGHSVALLGTSLPHRLIRQASREQKLFPAILGISLFWFLVVGYLASLPSWEALPGSGAGEGMAVLLMAFSLGGAVGALFCARISAGRLEMGLVPMGAILMGVSGLYLAGLSTNGRLPEALMDISLWQWGAGFALVGVGGGLFVVPLYTLLQIISRDAQRGQMIAANNIVNAVSMVVAMLYATAMMAWLDVGQRRFVASLGVIALLVGLVLVTRRPRPVLRLLVFTLVHLIYRLRFRGRHHVPARGAALVVCNHVSFMDALVVGGASPRPLRFLMDRPIYESPWLNWWFRIVGAIPVDADRRDPGSVRRALDEVSHALRNGEVVMLFPEGRLTPDGDIHPFRRGLDIILARDPVPVVPAGLAGLWGSWTSHYGGRALTKVPRRFRARVALYFGEPLTPQQARRGEGEARVRRLKEEAERWVEPAAASLSDT